MLDGLVRVGVAADVEVARMVRGEVEGTPEFLATFLNAARANLQALGLHRRPTKVVDIAEYMEQAGVRAVVPETPCRGRSSDV